ncbi:lipase 3-like [Plodia interpunctella]|uniref:lipase 3-like n=1 Tax=Plodia interpunctella TaxID=58824 RepID=UPI00236803BB|nr:lipase 3-like [Plodia interpunctella]
MCTSVCNANRAGARVCIFNMKTALVLFTVVIISQCCESRWLPQDLIETVFNKTSQISNYVKQKGRSIRHFYDENIRRPVTYLVGNDKNDKKYISRNGDSTEDFKNYIDKAQANQEQVFDAIAPKNPKVKCIADNPAIHMTTPQLLALYGYVAESHTVVTEDGYILTIHRIPFSKNSKVGVPRKTVLLHHGLLGSSADWILPGPEKGLGFILSEAGYDVWMANVRGNTYSRAHISKNVDTFAFWNFTFHEVSQHDLPAVIDYIMEIKGWDVKINYIGHSMGTTVLFALLSTKTQYNKVLRAGFALAPVAYMTDIKSPIRLLARYSDNLEFLLKLLGANEFLPQNAVLRWLSKHACEINHYEEVICENSLFVLCGHDASQFNKTLLPIILGHVPAGASTKTLVHYAQEIKSGGRFQQFDYGPEGNFKEYGNNVPPEYPVHKITLPIALLSAENDWLASDEDVTNLYVHLTNPIEHYVVPLKQFNHIDFLWAIDANKYVYSKLLELLEEGVSKVDFNPKVDTNELNDDNEVDQTFMIPLNT